MVIDFPLAPEIALFFAISSAQLFIQVLILFVLVVRTR